MLKRVLDFIIALLMLIILSPVIIAVWVAIACTMGRPVLFRQRRAGKDSAIFTLAKFRTMTDARGRDGRLLTDAERLTGFGRLLRATSLDELPQLFNVLAGDMSLVGPRPLLPEYLERYSPRQARRHEVRPGITGWAQVNGRNAISWEEKFEYDVWYVDHRSLWLDLRILFMTLAKVVKSEGIAATGQATTEEFTGSAKEIPIHASQSSD